VRRALILFFYDTGDNQNFSIVISSSPGMSIENGTTIDIIFIVSQQIYSIGYVPTSTTSAVSTTVSNPTLATSATTAASSSTAYVPSSSTTSAVSTATTAASSSSSTINTITASTVLTATTHTATSSSPVPTTTAGAPRNFVFSIVVVLATIAIATLL